jgi:hypothetical protein
MAHSKLKVEQVESVVRPATVLGRMSPATRASFTDVLETSFQTKNLMES